MLMIIVFYYLPTLLIEHCSVIIIMSYISYINVEIMKTRHTSDEYHVGTIVCIVLKKKYMTLTNWEITFERLVYSISYKIH